MSRLALIAKVLRDEHWPDKLACSSLRDKFDELSKGEDYVSLADYEAQVREQMSKVPKDKQDFIVSKRMESIKKRDVDNDGIVTLSEYTSETFRNEMRELLGEADGGDKKMTKEELTKFLQELFVSEAQVDDVMTYFQEQAGATEVDTEAVVDGLFNLACPSTKERVAKLVKKVKKYFSPSKVDQREYQQRFDEKSKGHRSISLADFKGDMREALKQQGLTKKSRSKLIAQQEERLRQLHNLDLDKDGFVSYDEYVADMCFGNLLRSGWQYDHDWDGLADKDELVDWIIEVLFVSDITEAKEYADALLALLAKKRAGQPGFQEVLEFLFDKAFPQETSKYEKFINSVNRAFQLSTEEEEACEKEFKESAGDKDFITMDTYAVKARVDFEAECKAGGMPASLIKTFIDGAVDSKVEAMKGKDFSEDGRISLSEFKYWKVSDNLINSIAGDADGNDGKMDEYELKNWIENKLCMKGDTRQVAKAVMARMKEQTVDRKLDSWEFSFRLFEVAFPSDDILVRRVVESVRNNFALTDAEEQGFLAEFKSLASPGKSSVAKDEVKKYTEKKIKEKFPADMVDRVLAKRLEAIDKNDINNDGQVSANEWFRSQIYEKIFVSLHAHNTDGDLLMSRAEFKHWLLTKCSLKADMYTDACIGTFLGKDQVQAVDLKINDLMEKLFDLVCPSPAMRVKAAATAVLNNFKGNKDDATASLTAAVEMEGPDVTAVFVGLLTIWFQRHGAVDDAEENAHAVLMDATSGASAADVIDILVKA